MKPPASRPSVEDGLEHCGHDPWSHKECKTMEISKDGAAKACRGKSAVIKLQPTTKTASDMMITLRK